MFIVTVLKRWPIAVTILALCASLTGCLKFSDEPESTQDPSWDHRSLQIDTLNKKGQWVPYESKPLNSSWNESGDGLPNVSVLLVPAIKSQSLDPSPVLHVQCGAVGTFVQLNEKSDEKDWWFEVSGCHGPWRYHIVDAAEAREASSPTGPMPIVGQTSSSHGS